MKLSEKNSSKSSRLRPDKEFLDMTTKAQCIKKRKIHKLDFTKIKKAFSSKSPVKGVKRQATVWEMFFSNHISETGLTSRIYKKL